MVEKYALLPDFFAPPDEAPLPRSARLCHPPLQASAILSCGASYSYKNTNNILARIKNIFL